jgi:tetratricopeptide (TPR) repeat protein
VIRVSLALLGLALAVTRSAADPATADTLAADAAASAAAGDYKKAAGTFAEAFKEDPTRTDVFCNIGISYFKAGSLARAHLLISQCIERSSLDLAFKDNARTVLGSIEESLRKENHAPITLQPDPKNATVVVVAFGAESEFVGTRTVWLPFGPNQIEMRAEGFVTELLPVVVSDQQPKSVELRLKPKPVDLARLPKPPVPPGPKRAKWPAIASSVVTVGAVVATVIFSQKADDAAESGSFAVDQEAADSSPFPDEVSKWNRLVGISGTIAAVAGLASGYFWYRSTTREPGRSVEVAPTTGGAAVTFRGSF